MPVEIQLEDRQQVERVCVQGAVPVSAFALLKAHFPAPVTERLTSPSPFPSNVLPVSAFPRLEACTNVTAEVYMRSYLTPCINDCGTYGQCKLLRTNNYLYAACECKAGNKILGFSVSSMHSRGLQLYC